MSHNYKGQNSHKMAKALSNIASTRNLYYFLNFPSYPDRRPKAQNEAWALFNVLPNARDHRFPTNEHISFSRNLRSYPSPEWQRRLIQALLGGLDAKVKKGAFDIKVARTTVAGVLLFVLGS